MPQINGTLMIACSISVDWSNDSKDKRTQQTESQTNLPAEQTDRISEWQASKTFAFFASHLRQTRATKAILGSLKYPIHNLMYIIGGYCFQQRQIWHEVIVWQMYRCYNTCCPRLEFTFCKVFTTFRCMSLPQIHKPQLLAKHKCMI